MTLSTELTSVTTVGVMARAPIPGRCKTRLAMALGADRAASLYRAMLLDTLDALTAVGFTHKIVMAAPEGDGVAVLRRLVPPDWDTVPQRGDGLGARLTNATIDLAPRSSAVILCSSDSPTLPAGDLRTSLPALANNRGLLGPCADGGYYLIGVARADLRLFEGVSWSTSVVAAQTRERFHACGYDVRELPEGYDVDEPRDVERLREELSFHPERAVRCAEILVSGR